MSILLELLFEFVFQFVVEFLVEMGAHALKRDREPDRPPSAVAAFLAYSVLGGVLGLASCLMLPLHLFVHPSSRLLNLVVTPIAVGLAMGAIGAWRSRRGTALVRLDKFAYGYAFALAFALTRWACGGAV